MTRFVLDMSVALAWCFEFEDEDTAYADRILDLLVSQEALVPSTWPIGVGDTLLEGERCKQITAAETFRSLRLLCELPIRIAAPEDCSPIEDLVSLSRTHQLSVYRAAFLSLAMREGIPLATLDSKLQETARRVGVPLL